MPLQTQLNKKRTTFTGLVVKGLLLFSIFTVLQGLDAFDSINRIWLIVVCLALMGRLLTYRYTVKEFFVLVVTLLLHVIAVAFTDFPLYNSNMLYYFLLWVLLYMYFAKSKGEILAELESSKVYINLVLWCWTILVGVSAFVPSCYQGSYFLSFAGTSFRLMPAALIISALAMYMAQKHKDWRYNFFLILPTYAAFMNQSRTYFGVFVLFLVMYIYMTVKSKQNFYLLMIPVGLITVAAVLVSGIGDKMEATWYEGNSFEDFLASFTSGRSVFWKWDLEAFLELSFWQQFVGNGFNFPYDVTAQHLNNGIWAHNDLINMLMNFGYIGVVIYLWAYFKLIRAFWNKNSYVPTFTKLLFFGAGFLNSMMNMSYTYFCAVIAYPLFLCAIDARYNQCEETK